MPTLRAVEREVDRINDSDLLPPGVRIQRIYKEATQVHTKPKFCLHEGQKVALRHRLVVIPTKHDRAMTLYFAKLPGHKILLGWVEERPF